MTCCLLPADAEDTIDNEDDDEIATLGLYTLNELRLCAYEVQMF